MRARGSPRPSLSGRLFAAAKIAGVLLVLGSMGCAGRGWLVRKVDFSGNNNLSRRKLLDRMVSKPSSPVDWVPWSHRALEDDVRMLERYYRNEGFLQARVETHNVRLDSTRQFAYITIVVEEGKRTFVRAVRMSGNTLIDEEALLRKVKTSVGRPLIGTTVDKDRTRITGEYGERGYLQSVAQPNIELVDNRDSALVSFAITENKPTTVDTLVVSGLKRVRRKLVDRELRFTTGDTLTTNRLSASIRNMYQTDLFRTVSIRPILRDSAGTPLDTVPKRIDITLEEDDLIDLSLGVGYGTEDQLRGSAGMLYRNLFGLGKRISLEGKSSFIEQEAKVVYTDPSLLGLPGRFDLSGHFTHFDDGRSYAARYGGGKAALSFTTPFKLAYGLGLRWEAVDYLWVAGGSDSTLDKPIQSISLNATYDRRNDLFNPSEGVYASARAEIAGLGGAATSQFYRLRFNLRGFAPIRSKWVLSSSATIGYAQAYGADTDVPPRERFYAGGNSSLRGFKTRMVGPLSYEDDKLKPNGGRLLLELHLVEIRYPIYKRLNGTVFLDAGSVARNVNEFTDKGIRWSAGFGLNVVSPLGIIRADLAFPLNPNPYAPTDPGAPGEPAVWYHVDIGHAF